MIGLGLRFQHVGALVVSRHVFLWEKDFLGITMIYLI
jgi:hypothetical protein